MRINRRNTVIALPVAVLHCDQTTIIVQCDMHDIWWANCFTNNADINQLQWSGSYCSQHRMPWNECRQSNQQFVGSKHIFDALNKQHHCWNGRIVCAMRDASTYSVKENMALCGHDSCSSKFYRLICFVCTVPFCLWFLHDCKLACMYSY